MFFSIIIPVRNAALYLPQCLDSIERQSFSYFEVILVDDASEDNSPAICAEYGDKDTRYHLICQEENRGAAAARNIGLGNAQGQYITFMDSDDFWGRDDALHLLHELILSNNYPDIIGSPMGDYFDCSGTIKTNETNIASTINSLDYPDAMDHLITLGHYSSSASGKIVKRTLVTENNLQFPEGLRNNEDTAWSVSILYVANSIKWLDHTYYFYRRQTPNSASKTLQSANQLDAMGKIISNHLRILDTQQLDEYRIKHSNSFIAYFYIIYLARLFVDKSSGYKERRAAQRMNSWLLHYHGNKRVRLAYYAYRVLGYHLTGHLLAIALKHEERTLLRR